jgi:NDP-sugar pyrophosphorylase family protein
LLEVAGEPFLMHQLRILASYGAKRVVLCVGYLGELVVARIGERQVGVEISYSHDGPELIGTLGAIRKAVPLLGDRFLVLYGDTYLRIDYAAASEAWANSGLPAMMTALHNKGRWEASNAIFNGRLITAYDKRRPNPAMEWIDYGLGGLTADALARVSAGASDLAELYHVLAHDGQLFGYAATERFYEIGTPEALAATSAFLAAKVTQPKELA